MGSDGPWPVVRMLALAVVGALAPTGPIAAAEPSAADRETARTLMKAGDAHLEAGESEAALRAYSAADALVHVPSTGLGVLRALVRLGRLVEARDVALRIVRSPRQDPEPAAWSQAREAAATAARELEPRIPGLVVHAAGARIVIDGAALPEAAAGLVRKLNPGPHVVEASAPGRRTARVEVILAEGEMRALHLSLPPLPAPVPPSAPVGARAPERESSAIAPASTNPAVVCLYAGLATAAAGLGVGTVTGVLALERAEDLQTSCPSNGCPASRRTDLETARRYATAANVGFLVGLAGVGLGLYGYFSLDTPGPAAQPGEVAPAGTGARPFVGPGQLGLEGHW